MERAVCGHLLTIWTTVSAYNISSMLEWCAKDQGVSHLYHYLDHYIMMGNAEFEEWNLNTVTLLATCNRLGVPIAPDKCKGPTTMLMYLGIEADTVQMQLRLPEEKLKRVQATVAEWLGRKAGQQYELESLIGLLQHAARVEGCRFVRRINVVMTTVKDRDRSVCLNAEIRSDLYLWSEFIANWNEIGIIPNLHQAIVNLESGQLGLRDSMGTTLASNGSGIPQFNNEIYPLRSFCQYFWNVLYGESCGRDKGSGLELVVRGMKRG